MASRSSRRSRERCTLERGHWRSRSRVAKSAASFDGAGSPAIRNVVATGARDAREPWRRSVRALSESRRITFSSWAGPTMRLASHRRPEQARSATTPGGGRSQAASRRGAAALASQETDASGAGRAGSTKGMEAPGDGAGRMAADAAEQVPASKATGPVPSASAQAVVSLVVGIASEKFPGKITRAQRQDVVIVGNLWRPGGADIGPGHDTTTTALHVKYVYVYLNALG